MKPLIKKIPSPRHPERSEGSPCAVILTISLLILSMSLHASPFGNINCPSAQTIKSEGLYRVREVNYGQYKGEQFSYYRSRQDWRLFIYPITASSDSEAFDKGIALLNDIKGEGQFDYKDGIIYCHYSTGQYGVSVIASTFYL